MPDGGLRHRLGNVLGRWRFRLAVGHRRWWRIGIPDGLRFPGGMLGRISSGVGLPALQPLAGRDNRYVGDDRGTLDGVRLGPGGIGRAGLGALLLVVVRGLVHLGPSPFDSTLSLARAHV
jgi:hypothetical protein